MRTALLTLFILVPGLVWAAGGLEVQVYPAGIQADGFWAAPVARSQELLGYAGYNEAQRWGWGLHANERGGGPGFGLGWRGFLHDRSGLNLSVRTEVWFLDIIWKDSDGVTGLTEVAVLQPSLELAWRFQDEAMGSPEFGLSLGQEINVVTEGEAVGQGAILRVRSAWYF